MDFRIADTFTDSLSRLTSDEQKAVKTTAFDLQMNPISTGMSFHKLTKAKDKNFWSVRVNDGIRLIVHRTDSSLLLCYVDHHDAAYGWAERRKIERHPKTGAAQLVEIRETVREIEVPRYVDAPQPKAVTKAKPLFTHVTDDDLLGYGVPPEWLADVRGATEDTLLDVADHLPREASEALLELATGSTPKKAMMLAENASPFAHPDAQRRFRVMSNVEELQRALEYPWDKWMVFLHPAQRDLVERKYNGPVRVSGSAGTGKTIVALHRAVYLARSNPAARVLLATFSPILSRFLRRQLERLAGNEPAVMSRIEVAAVDDVAIGVLSRAGETLSIADGQSLATMLEKASASAGVSQFTAKFLQAEWRDVVDAWQLRTWESYRDVPRLGRKTRLTEKHRQTLWSVFERVWQALDAAQLTTMPSVFARATELTRRDAGLFAFAVLDECQDVSVAQLRFFASVTQGHPEGLFFTGDLGQRIFQTPFSWKSLGVDIRGRSHTLRINYRTSHQIRRQADRLLPEGVSDVDGNAEQRKGTVSVFNGPDPMIVIASSVADECTRCAAWIKLQIAGGIQPEEIGMFVRTEEQLARATRIVSEAGLKCSVLDGVSPPAANTVSVSTMHQAKGLEFRAAAVVGVDEDVLPLQSRVEAITDEADLEEVYSTERHLFYVACTRARDSLWVSAVAPASEFIDDMKA